MSAGFIDVDEPQTWPKEVHVWVSALRAEPDSGREDEFRRLLNRPMIAFHATRLLDHERDAIRLEGLKVLTQELTQRRIDDAYEHRSISKEERDLLRGFHDLALKARFANDRPGQVCLFLSCRTFTARVTGLRGWLSIWGGEGLFAGTPEIPKSFESLGRPSIVEAAVDLSTGSQQDRVYPPLQRVFWKSLRVKNGRAHVYMTHSIQSEHILDIWQPGHEKYDRYKKLPQS